MDDGTFTLMMAAFDAASSRRPHRLEEAVVTTAGLDLPTHTACLRSAAAAWLERRGTDTYGALRDALARVVAEENRLRDERSRQDQDARADQWRGRADLQ